MVIPKRRALIVSGALFAAVGLFFLATSNALIDRPTLLFGKAKADLIHDAHRLQSADAFLPHIRAVTEMSGTTMADAKAGCTWLGLGDVNFQFSGDFDWIGQDRDDAELASRRSEWHHFVLEELLPYAPHEGKFQGRGIVIVAGDEESMMRVRVLLQALKKLGSELPVELHYWDDEISPRTKESVASIYPDISFNDLARPYNIVKATPFKPSPGSNFKLPNYSFKSAAIINSRFAEPLLLDSDNIPVIRPETLYDSDVYQEFGTIFWPDIARTRPNNPMWTITNTQCRMDEYEQESGQLLVDKRKFFYHLQLAAWYNNAQGVYYNQFLLGDKDMFRFAWHALKTPYGRPSKWLTSVGTLGDDGYYCGHTFAQHHPDGRVAFLHGGLLKTMANEVMTWQRKTRGGVFQVYKRSEYDEDPRHNEPVGIKWDPASYLPNRPDDIRVAACTDFYDVDAKPLDEIVPKFEQTYEDIGGYWMLNGLDE